MVKLKPEKRVARAVKSTKGAARELLKQVKKGGKKITKAFVKGTTRKRKETALARVAKARVAEGRALKAKEALAIAAGQTRTTDAIDDYIDANKYRVVFDEAKQENVVLTDAELNMLERIAGGEYGDSNFDPYEDYKDFFHYPEGKIFPLSAAPEPKRRFLPSKWEAKKVVKIVRAIREGRIKPKDEKEEPEFHLLWDPNAEQSVPDVMHMPAPKLPLPGHEASYNPPVEYLLSPEEEEEWKKTDPELRTTQTLPSKYSALRKVPLYPKSVQERFERCLDLYLCPRAKKRRMHVDDPESLLPKLPPVSDLRPFPIACTLEYTRDVNGIMKAHSGRIVSVRSDSTGQLLATASNNGELCIWEVDSGRILHYMSFEESISCLEWCPGLFREKDEENSDAVIGSTSLIAVAVENTIVLVNAAPKGTEASLSADKILKDGTSIRNVSQSDSEDMARWIMESTDTTRVTIELKTAIRQLSWHHKGDYFVTVAPNQYSTSVLVHRLTVQKSQNPFTKHKGITQCALFHPQKPLIFVATKQHIRIFDLAQHRLVKKLISGSNWISDMRIHPNGEHLIVGTYDQRLLWFDLSLSATPFKTLRYHQDGLNQVDFHRRYPLFASCSNDCTTHIFHGRVYNDFSNDPLIVPLKVLKGHTEIGKKGVMSCSFHPTQPWIFSGGADGRVKLWT